MHLSLFFQKTIFGSMTTYGHDTVVPFRHSADSKKKQLEQMFDKIAFRYDFLNHVLSAGIDKGWRRKAINQLSALQPKKILDVATGTGDFAIQSFKMLSPDHVTGIDISVGMLDIGKKKVAQAGLGERIALEVGDSEAILFDDNSFDAVTVAFGVRNFENLQQGLSEIYRVLKPGGKLVVLECSRPDNAIVRSFYNLYVNKIMPAIGKAISKNKFAYQYLTDSVQNFPEKKTFIHLLNQLAYRNAFYKTLTFGICTIYCGEK